MHSSGRLQGLLSRVHFLRQESLNQGLFEFLVSLDHSPHAVDFILTMEKVYPDERPEWRGYYTPELMGLVRSREWLLFSLFPQYDGK